MAFRGLARAKPAITTAVPGEMGWSNWLGNQLDASWKLASRARWMFLQQLLAVIGRTDACEVIEDVLLIMTVSLSRG